MGHNSRKDGKELPLDFAVWISLTSDDNIWHNYIFVQTSEYILGL